MSRKILKHIDREEIIARLTNGESVRAVEAWLKEKYPKSKQLWITLPTLQTFRKEHLQLDGKVLKDLQETGKLQRRQEEELELQQKVATSNAYQKKLLEITDTKLDVARKIVELDAIIGDRMQYWFDAVKSGEQTAIKGDRELREFMDRQMNLLAQYKKFVEGLADKTVDYNVNITVVNDQINIIRDVIRECIAEMAPEQAMMFMDLMNRKMSALNYRPIDVVPVRVEDLQEAEIEPSDKLVVL